MTSVTETMAPGPQDAAADGPEPGLRAGSAFLWPIEAAAAALLVFIIGLLLTGVLWRYGFGSPLIWVDELASLAFLWFAMLGAAIAIDRAEHLRLTVLVNRLSPASRRRAQTAALGLMAAFLVSLLHPAWDYMVEESYITSAALHLPMSIRTAALPVGVGLMLLLVLRDLMRAGPLPETLAILALIGAGALGFWLLSPLLAGLGYANIAIFMVGLVGLCLALGTPIAFCFGLGALTFLAFTTSMPMMVIVGRMDEGMSSMVLLSVPIFVMLGCILDATGMGRAIVELLASMLGHVKAGMSYVLLGSLFLVSGISGSKVSDMATVAPALFPEMKRRGHKPREMIALLATGAAMADTVPPSIVLIVLGSVAGVSIAGLFTSGFVIAMVLLLVLAILARWKARHEVMGQVRRAPMATVGKAALIAAPALVLPFLIRSAVAGGVATATEVSTIAVLYALVIGMLLYGGISTRRMWSMLVETAALSGAILIILGAASAMAWALTQTGFAFHMANLVTGLPGGWVTFMLVTILVFTVLGCVLEGLPAIVLMAPIMYPIAARLGINDIHYSMVVVTAMNVGLMMPPIGIGFYIACKIGAIDPDEAMGAIWPYIGALIVGLLLIAFFPALSIAYL